MNKSNIESNNVTKIKATIATIVVRGNVNKPYYVIEYIDTADGKVHIGYGSYNLNNVFKWLKECFEIIG